VSLSPTQRSLDHARKMGWDAAITEHWNPHARIRQDLFGFGDILVFDDEPGVLFVQATSGSHVANRMRKLEEMPIVRLAVSRGNRVEVWGWRRVKVKRGGKAVRWEVRKVWAECAPGGVVWHEKED